MSWINYYANFPEKTREEKLLHKIVFLIPAIGTIGFLFFRNPWWMVIGLLGHVIAKLMYLESRMFSINLDQYHRMKELGFYNAVYTKPTDIDELLDDKDPIEDT